MLKVIELFAGYRSQSLALRNLGVEYEVVGISEIDKYAIEAGNLIHNDNVVNFGDITKISNLPYCDLLTYSFPCFIKGTKILTYEGFKNIEDIKCGDEVLTHKNRYKKVIKPMTNQSNHIYKLSTMCSDDLFVTEEHPFFIREKFYEYDNNIRYYNGKMKKNRRFKEPTWIKVKDLNENHYVGVAINQENKLPEWQGCAFTWSDGRKDRHSNILKSKFESKEFWWIIGRYLGDGWIRSQGGIIICCEASETQEITEKLEFLEFNYSISEERTVNKIHISFKEIGEYVEQFGRGAKNKHLTKDIFNLPVNLLEGFLDGYMSADGCFTYGLNKATSISSELIYGIGQCVAKVYNRPFSIHKSKRPDKCIIEGRLVNQNDTFCISWKNTKNIQDKAFYENGYIWCPINKVEKLNYEGNVYNFEVEEDNSYVVQNIIAHNCQDISVAGKQEGIKQGTRSGLLFEVERIIENMKIKPKYLLLENVKNLVGKRHKADFDKWLNKLEQLGYNNYWQVLNAKDYGIPQNRERVFCVSVLKEFDKGYIFPEKQELTLRLKDVLEDNVEDKYYINNDISKNLLQRLNKNITNNTICEQRTDEGLRFFKDDCCGSLRTIDSCEDKRVIEPKVCKIGNIYPKRGQNGNIYDENYLCPTILSGTTDNPKNGGIGSNNSPKILTQEPKRIGNIYGEHCGTGFTGNVWDKEGISPTIMTMQGGNRQPMIEVIGDYMASNHDASRIVSQDGIAPTIKENHGTVTATYDNSYRIRKLTPKECFRLMGMKDSDIDKLEGISNSQKYKLAGNSIVVNVLEEIFKNLLS